MRQRTQNVELWLPRHRTPFNCAMDTQTAFGVETRRSSFDKGLGLADELMGWGANIIGGRRGALTPSEAMFEPFYVLDSHARGRRES